MRRLFRQRISIHLDFVAGIGYVQSGIHQIWRLVDGIQGCREKFDLLQARHGRDEENYAGMYFELLIASSKLEGIICDKNPIFLSYDFEDVPILRLAQPAAFAA